MSVISPAVAQEADDPTGPTDDAIPAAVEPEQPDVAPIPVVTLSPAPTSTPAPLTTADIASQVSGSLVQIVTDTSLGSGVRLDAGIITNEHVVRGADVVQVIAVDGRKGTGHVVSTDHTADLALVLSDLDVRPIEVESATQQRQGDELLVLGFARPDVIAGQPTLGRGLLSGLRRDVDGRLWVQTDAPMNHGDSGGAVVNMRGKLVGVVSFGITDAQNLNFAVASDTIQAFLGVPRAIRPEPTATPIPTPTLTAVQRDCASVAAALPPLSAAVQSATTAQASNDYQRLRALATDLRSRTYPSRVLPAVNAFLRVLDWSAGSAEIRANWPLLMLTASRTAGGDFILAAAQADLNNDDGQARLAEIDFESALRQLSAACGS